MSKPVKPRAESGRLLPEMVQIVVYGTRPGVDQIVREFYLCRFSDSTEWTAPQPVPNNPDQVMNHLHAPSAIGNSKRDRRLQIDRA